MALQALALYSTLVFSPDGSTRVIVTSPSASNAFLVNKDNKLLYQEKELVNIEGKHILQASGSGCAAVQVCNYSCSPRLSLISSYTNTLNDLFLQLSVFYNIPAPAEVRTLTVEVTESANCASTAARVTMTLDIKTG